MASCKFTNGTNTETDTTDTSGNATSSTCTANSLEGGPYTVKATASVGEADFSLTNTAVVVTSHNYVFYLNGIETINNVLGLNYYALAGSVTIDPNGNVVAGKQDYNDGFGLTSPQSGNAITGGTLTVDSNGQGTLTLVTDNPSLGLAGTETLGVQFVNTKHARIIHFDGSATSSGTLDMQTATSFTASTGYAFTFSGVDSSYIPVGVGGVFSTNAAGTSINGVADVNDGGTVTTQSPFSGTVTAADSLGRGSITGVSFDGTPIAINYYVVGPEVVRIIDVDTSDSAIGSAFGQGSATFTSASLGSSAFGILDTPWGASMGAAGMFATNAAGTFQGVGDVDEYGTVVSGSAIAGTYSISENGAPNGYGSLTIDNGGLEDVGTMGMYMTDPNLNLIDPNNPSGGGGALTLDLGSFPGASGVIVPQTDTSPTSFAGNYAFGAQDYNGSIGGWEFDFVGQGSVAGSPPKLTGTGLVNDDLEFFTTIAATYSGVPFSGTTTLDGANPGRYTMNPLVVTVASFDTDFDTVIYQASGNQLFWLEKDDFGLFLGTMEKQGSLTGLPAVRRPVMNTKSNRKQ
jgi:hypothetical protein